MTAIFWTRKNTSVAAGNTSVQVRQLRRLIAMIDVQEAVRRRAVQEAVAAATSAYWLRRAQTFDSVGTAASDEVALACRNHARLLSGEFGDIAPWPGFGQELDDVLSGGGLDV